MNCTFAISCGTNGGVLRAIPKQPKHLHFFLRRRVRTHSQLLQVHAHLISSGRIVDAVAAGLLLHLASKISSLSHALLLIRNLPLNLPLFAVNSLVRAVSRCHPYSKHAVSLFSSLLHLPRFVPNRSSFSSLLSSCAKSTDLFSGKQLHSQLIRRGLLSVGSASIHVANALVHFYAACGHKSLACALFEEMSDKDTVSYNSLLTMYFSLRDCASAYELFDSIPRRNVVTWNIMIAGHLKMRNPDLALVTAREMARSGVHGTAATMVSVITASARLGKVRMGKEAHGYFLRGFKEDNVVVWTGLIDMYGKCRKVGMARKVFDQVVAKNLICWNAMIFGHCVYGDNPAEGISLFLVMVGKEEEPSDTTQPCGSSHYEEASKLAPDEITFIGVLCACARLGLLSEGQKYFKKMTSVYCLKPTFAHYWCIANLYGNLGLKQDAEEFLRSMPERTNSLALGVLLGLCRFRGEHELGEQIALLLIDLEPDNSIHYALLCSVYAAANRWEDARNVKIMMEERDIAVRAGHRLVDLNDIVHNFIVGDGSLETHKVQAILSDLAAKLQLTIEKNDI